METSLRRRGAVAARWTWVWPLFERMNVASIINQHLPADPQAEFDHGTVLSLLIAARREAALRHLTLTDSLTGLNNRRGFALLADNQWQLARRNRADRKSTRLNSSHRSLSRMPSSA